MDTKTQILDVGEALMKQAGYSGMSYADIAKAVEIRKASIHYHFPSKVDLAREAVHRYRQRMQETLARAPEDSIEGALKTLGDIFEAAFCSPGGGCLCGSLAGDWQILPEEVQKEVQNYWQESIAFIKESIRSHFPRTSAAKAQKQAEMIFSLFEGALVTARVQESAAPLKAAPKAALSLLN